MKVFAQFAVVAAWVCDNRFGQIHQRKTYFMCSLVTILPSQNPQKVDSKSTCLAAGWTMFEDSKLANIWYVLWQFLTSPKKPIRTPFKPVRACSSPTLGTCERNRSYPYPFKTRSKAVRNPFGFSRDFPLFSFMNLKVWKKVWNRIAWEISVLLCKYPCYPVNKMKFSRLLVILVCPLYLYFALPA